LTGDGRAQDTPEHIINKLNQEINAGLIERRNADAAL
jgi:hypothetical protein